jgi:hypothetical protein
MTALFQRLKAALPVAMKARDKTAVAALRSTLAAIENAAAVEVPGATDPRVAVGLPAVGLGVTEAARRTQDDAEIARIVRAEITDRLTAADDYDRLGRAEQSERLRAEAAVLAAHLGDA